MEALETIKKTREYLDYIERHILNVEKAWSEIQEKCKNMRFIYDDYVYNTIDAKVKHHDMSKLENEEFVYYRMKFYPTDTENKFLSKQLIDKNFQEAWKHHYTINDHHWENWLKKHYLNSYEGEINCVHMIIDWLAMSYEFGDTPRGYYEKNKGKIHLPNWAIKFIYEIFDKLEK